MYRIHPPNRSRAPLEPSRRPRYVARMQTVVIPLAISADQWLPYYRGQVKSVRATALDGRRVQFPARVLQKYVTPDGVLGVFRVRFDAHNRFVDIEQLGGPKGPGGRLA